MTFHRGFTVIEIIVVIGISAVLLVALLRFLVAGYPLSKLTYLQQRSTETARIQLRRIAKILREVRSADTGAYPIVEMAPMRLIVYANVDSDTATERVRYELIGNTLERGIIKPTGSPATYNLASETVTTLATSIQNGATPLFTYYGGDYPEVTTALTSADLTEVRYVEFHLIIDADTAVDPPPIEVVSQVQLRNLKSNLAETVEN